VLYSSQNHFSFSFYKVWAQSLGYSISVYTVSEFFSFRFNSHLQQCCGLNKVRRLYGRKLLWISICSWFSSNWGYSAPDFFWSRIFQQEEHFHTVQHLWYHNAITYV